jgi:hypothetical protein
MVLPAAAAGAAVVAIAGWLTRRRRPPAPHCLVRRLLRPAPVLPPTEEAGIDLREPGT